MKMLLLVLLVGMSGCATVVPEGCTEIVVRGIPRTFCPAGRDPRDPPWIYERR